MRYFCLLLFASVMLHATHVSWYGDFEQARQASRKTGKTLMVLLAKKEDSTTATLLQSCFMNQPYIGTIHKYFIAVLIIEGVTRHYPSELLYTLTYPTLFFLNRNELFTCKPIREPLTANMLEDLLTQCR